MGVNIYTDEGRVVTKPGDTAAARAIGTYPYLPECGDNDPEFSRYDTFGTDGSHRMYYTGPAGRCEVSLIDGVYRVTTFHFADDGTRVDDRVVYEHIFAGGR